MNLRPAVLLPLRAFGRLLARLALTRGREDRLVPSSLQRLAVLLDSGIGDTLMATPLLTELRRQLPRAVILAVVNRGTAQVLVHNPDVDACCVFRDSGGSARLNWGGVRNLRSFRPQVMLVPQTGNTLVQIFAACISGAPVRIKHRFDYPPERRYSDFEFLFTHSPLVRADQHRVLDNLALLVPLGLTPPSDPPGLRLVIRSQERATAGALLRAKGWCAETPTVVIHPGVGTATLNKQWPSDRFAALGRELVRRLYVQVVLVGGRAEVSLCENIARAVGPRCFVVAGECSLAETAAIIETGRLFVSNDSGLMHVAAAVGARGVALFGKTNPVKIGPWGGTIRVVQARDMESLSVEQVLAACENQWHVTAAERTS